MTLTGSFAERTQAYATALQQAAANDWRQGRQDGLEGLPASGTSVAYLKGYSCGQAITKYEARRVDVIRKDRRKRIVFDVLCLLATGLVFFLIVKGFAA